MPINPEAKEAIDDAHAAAAAATPAPEQPAAPVQKKPFYKKGTFWIGTTLFAAAAAGVVAWFVCGGDAATTAADASDAATDAANA